MRWTIVGVGAAAAAAALGFGAAGGAAAPCTPIPQPPLGRLAALQLAPEATRADLCAPAFSAPARITNPLFPISRLRSAVLLGRVDGKRFRTETTLLPRTKTIVWNGRRIAALESQYVAYLGGRLHEVALDWYAQADDGAVWYLGEDVFNYEKGVVADTDGTWLTGREGPAAMIMPARPKVGDAFRPENAPGIVFEEVVVERAGVRVAGPAGPVNGAIVTRELHQDGTTERKLFAPGYGEFLTGSGGDVEALALAVATDALPGPVPPALRALVRAAQAADDAAAAGDWAEAGARAAALRAAWARMRARPVPPRIAAETSRAVRALTVAVAARRPHAARLAAIDAATSGLDLQLRHRRAAAVDAERFALWLRRIEADAAAGDRGAVRAGAATLVWVRDRFAQALTAASRRSLDERLRYLTAAAQAGELDEAARAAVRLRASPARR